jgi:2-keto-myo-inositol isomerase
MKLAFHGASTMTCDLETDIAISARAGFGALELWVEKIDRYLADHSLNDLRKLFTDFKVLPLALNSIEFIAFRGNEYEIVQTRLHELGKIAQAIGCPTVIIVASPLPDRTLPWTDIVSEYVNVLRDLSGIARTYQIRLSFESLGFGWSSVRTPRGAFEIIQKADCDNVGLTVDAAHFFNGGGLMNEIDRLDPARIFAFHLNDLEDAPKEAIRDSTRLLPGLGMIPLGELCARLKNIGYDGSCSIELFRPEYWDWDPLELAHKAYQAALTTLSPYFRVN